MDARRLKRTLRALLLWGEIWVLLLSAAPQSVAAQSSPDTATPPASFSQPAPVLHPSLPPNAPYNPYRSWATLPVYAGGAEPAPPASTLRTPAGVDLDVMFISRTPLYHRYEVVYEQGTPLLAPGTETLPRWPEPGEVITFTAHIANKGTQASPAFAWRWLIDGAVQSFGVSNALDAGATTTVDLAWPWGHLLAGERLLGQHSVQFIVDPTNQIAETYESNNALTDRTDAMSLVLAVTPRLYRALETPVDPRWPFSAEDWLQKQIAAMNALFAQSVYPSAPNGVEMRVRLDRIEIAAQPPEADSTLDGGFYMTADDRYGNGYYQRDSDVSLALIHELGHQLGLIDLYNLDVPLETPQVVDKNGHLVQMEHNYLPRGMMSGITDPPIRYEEYSVQYLNQTRGYRRGYYGEMIFALPRTSYVRVLDSAGNPAPGVTVRIFQRGQRPLLNGSLHGVIDNTPEIAALTHSDGIATLPNRAAGPGITTRTGFTQRPNPFGQLDVVGFSYNVLIELTKGSHQEYLWSDTTRFTLLALQGQSTLTLASHIPPAGSPQPPAQLTALLEKHEAKLSWQASPSPSVRSYNLYRGVAPNYELSLAVEGITDLHYTDRGPIGYNSRASVYAVTAVTATGEESGFSELVWALRLLNPSSVTLAGNDRLVLDPQSPYSLLVQDAEGTYLDTLGSFDLPLDRARYLTRDAMGKLLFTRMDDPDGERNALLVTDDRARLIQEIGSSGFWPGEFSVPAGIAAWGNPCTYGGPYDDDARTALLLHFDGSLQGVDGTPGEGENLSFAAGHTGQGVRIGDGARLSYPTRGHFNAREGALEFWFKPDWDGAEADWPVFFELLNADPDLPAQAVLLLNYDNNDFLSPGNNLMANLANNETSIWAGGWTPTWQAGEWYHIGMVWRANDTLRLYVNGAKIAETPYPITYSGDLAERMFIGMSSTGTNQVRGVIDELRISKVARLGDTDTCPYRLIVADSGNNRLETFDWFGNLWTLFGSTGSGNQQFNNPQGVALTPDGRVVVVDAGNQRLQVLQFDGHSFAYVASIEADLNQPTGISLWGDNQVIVADTGNSRIKVFDLTMGTLLAEFSTPNDEFSGEFSRPRSAVGDAAGTLIVADTGNARVVTVRGALPVAPPARMYLPLMMR